MRHSSSKIWLIILLLLAHGCAYLSIEKKDNVPKTTSIHSEVETSKVYNSCVIIGEVINTSKVNYPFLILAQPLHQNQFTTDHHVIISRAGAFMLYVPEGKYQILAIADLNENAIFESDEIAGIYDRGAAIEIKKGDVKNNIQIHAQSDFISSFSLSGDLAIKDDHKAVVQVGYNGQLRKIYDGVFSQENATAGWWFPSKFMKAYGAGIYLLEKYDPQNKELAKRGTLVYGLYKEIRGGRGPVYMDATGISEEDYYTLEQVEKKGILLRLKECGVDYKKERFEWVSPAVHGFLGGLKVDPDCRTAIAGLYAAGENAGGVYGADRVGSYLTACTVFGLRAGKNASKTALNSSYKDVPGDALAGALDELHRFKSQKQGRRPGEVLKLIKEIAGKQLACERNAKGLQEAIQQFGGIMESELHQIQIKTCSDFIRALEIRNLCLTGKLVATAALHRKETRGQHRRSDYPPKDPAWLKHIILQKDGDKIKVTTRKIG